MPLNVSARFNPSDEVLSSVVAAFASQAELVGRAICYRHTKHLGSAAKAFDSPFPAYMVAQPCRFLFRKKAGGTSFARPRRTALKTNAPPASASSRAPI